jgi:PAS domain S-box-containing protein
MFDFLSKLFDTSDFPARWQCGNWTAGLGWLHILSDLAVWSAYVAIPLVLGYFAYRRKDIPFRGFFVLFGAFILACGTTHLMEALIFYWPAYRLAGLIKLFTAMVSWGTLCAMAPVTPRALAMRTPEELEREILARKEAENALQKANAELKHQVEELRASDERFRLLVDGTRDYAIYMLDPAGRVIFWNAGAQRIKQYRAEEILGQHFARFFLPEEVAAKKPDACLRIAAEQGRHEEEGWRLRKDGSRFWASTVITALRDGAGNLRGFSKITRDITERKRAEASALRLVEEEAARRAAEQHASAVHQERERLRVTLQCIGDGVIATDDRGRVTLMNPVAEALTGWQPDQALKRPLADVFHIVNEETRKEVESPVAKALRLGLIVGLANHTLLIARDGQERPIDDSAAPIKNEKGETIGVVLVFRDATSKRAAEEVLREADRRKDRFLATLAHELRNPLAPLRTGLHLLRISRERAVREQTREMMERQLGQLIRLVDDLLDISRITRNKLELRKARITLAAVLENAVETVRPLIDGRGHHLAVTLPGDPILIDADLTRLAQVFWNLLHNSVKYTDPGGRIELTAEVHGPEAAVSVKDTGIGIPAEAMPRLFEIFSQVDQSIAGADGGLGIGLALVKGLVEMHDGTIEVRSDGVGRGSEFVVRLPVAQGPAPAARPQPHQVNHHAVPRRILVVDDNRDAAATLSMILTSDGHDTRTAHDGLVALELAESFRPEVVLLDIGLPKLNGYDTCHRLRERPWCKDVTIIAVTGWGQEGDRRRTNEVGFNLHMVKPIDIEALERLLAEMPAQME